MIDIITLHPKPGDKTKAILNIGGRTINAALGRSGLGVLKKEGDGRTPITTLKLLYGFYRKDRISQMPQTPLCFQAITQKMGWCDEASNANYNRLVKLPFLSSHEIMWRDDELYDVCIVLDWNISSRKRKAGSAIFFHIARENYSPTEGCIAVSKRDMLTLLPHVSRQTRFVINL